ncbi:hypothetical protein O0L34_g1443 [Tuta absoluta]|nr:hypothetical protein O0L34_g1443 [Tuta absoluta]
MSSLEQLAQMIKNHLGEYNFNKWTVAESPVGGRGLFATEDIQSGEVIFVDRPLVYGPRSGAHLPKGCTVCSRIESDSFFKCSKCALVLCSDECQNSIIHQDDCHIISRWNNKVPIEEIDDTVTSKALAVIRILLLDEEKREFMAALEAHKAPRHGFEVRNLMEYFEIPEVEEKLMLMACRAFDTNAYQISTSDGRKEISMRGLYPVSSLMNSNCVPNVRYRYDSENQMVVISAKAIPAGTEIQTCYTGVLWGTPARQLHLKRTKHFTCKCDRCIDPTERGTLLSALKCFSAQCQGSLIPTKPLVPTAPWRCLECDMRVPSQNICSVQNALGSMLAMVEFRTIDELENFLLHRIIKLVPKTNQIVLDLQLRLACGMNDIRYQGN